MGHCDIRPGRGGSYLCSAGQSTGPKNEDKIKRRFRFLKKFHFPHFSMLVTWYSLPTLPQEVGLELRDHDNALLSQLYGSR